MRSRFGDELTGATRRALDDLLANFESPRAQGPDAYASQMLANDPDLDATTLRADAILAVEVFHTGLFPKTAGKAS